MPETDDSDAVVYSLGEPFRPFGQGVPLEYRVTEVEPIVDHIWDPDVGITPTGLFLVVGVRLENVGERAADITTRGIQVVDEADRAFPLNGRASIYATRDVRIQTRGLVSERLAPGAVVDRVAIFDVPTGRYRLVVRSADAGASGETHAVALGAF
jgi:hypothetical protein